MDYDEFTDTQLYKSLDEFKTKLTPDELRRKVYKACVDHADDGVFMGLDAESLKEAFCWAETPEGWKYWMRIWESKHRGIVIKIPGGIVLDKMADRGLVPKKWPIIRVMA